MSQVPVIAIDGPSASGKGTVASRVAGALGWHYLDSGALYRLVALAAREAGVGPEDEAGLTQIARRMRVEFAGDAVRLDGREVGRELRSEEISAAASRMAALGAVRSALLDRQRAFRRPPGLVAEGRDMGSVVFPDARVKVFLTASARARARRRHKQLIEKGLPANMAGLLQELRERDARDAARAHAPLRRCADAVLLDTTGKSIEEAVAFVLDLAQGYSHR
ncbi:MAG: (d)CMP kinase [Rhodocyclaceae bacterium]